MLRGAPTKGRATQQLTLRRGPRQAYGRCCDRFGEAINQLVSPAPYRCRQGTCPPDAGLTGSDSVDSQAVETTLYSLSDAPPAPAMQSDRRDGDRHMTLYRVGSIMVDDRRELCLIKNISAGGMMIRAYCTLTEGTSLSVELKSGQPITGKVEWLRDQSAGIAYDQPIDVIEILSASMDGPRPRMPRIEASGFATVREGANALRVAMCDISQGGMKIKSEAVLPTGAEVVVSLPTLSAQRGVICWTDQGYTGITFNRLMPLGELVCWLQDRREGLRAAG